MEGVNHVVGVVLDRCTNAGIEVSEALAALTARSVRVHTSLSLAFYFSYYYPPPTLPLTSHVCISNTQSYHNNQPDYS
jgi:hypothetical protein